MKWLAVPVKKIIKMENESMMKSRLYFFMQISFFRCEKAAGSGNL